MKRRLTKYFLLFLVLIFLPIFNIFAQGAKVIKNNALLSNEYGTLQCPMGTVFDVMEKDNVNATVSGTLYGSQIKGKIALSDIELIDSPKKQSATTEPVSAEITEIKKPEKTNVETAKQDIEIVGKMRNWDFVKLFYEKVKEDFALKNTKSRELILKDKLPVVNSIDDVTNLRTGDVVVLEGNIFHSTEEFYIVMINNELYTRQDRPIFLARRGTSPQKKRDFKGYVAIADEQILPQNIDFPDQIQYFLEELTTSTIFPSINEFADSLKSGTSYQIKCPKCEGKGSKKDVKGKNMRCTNCRGTGLLSPETTINTIELEFMKKNR